VTKTECLRASSHSHYIPWSLYWWS